jgi:hypothetical protein
MPSVKITGGNGNAMAIVGACQRVARRAGWTNDEVDAFRKEALSGDYDNVLATAMKYFDVS